MAEVLNVGTRAELGKRNSKRLRRSGHVPAILYGHGQESLSIALVEEEFSRALRHGAKLFELKGPVSDTAIVREIQWDPFGIEVLHVDFMRISTDERLTLEISVELRGEAPGTKEGGIVTQLIHTVEIDTTPVAIPDRLHLNINSLQLGQSLTAADIEDLPQGATLLTAADTILVQCELPSEEVEEEPGLGEGAEPEVIGRKAADEDEEEE